MGGGRRREARRRRRGRGLPASLERARLSVRPRRRSVARRRPPPRRSCGPRLDRPGLPAPPARLVAAGVRARLRLGWLLRGEAAAASAGEERGARGGSGRKGRLLFIYAGDDAGGGGRRSTTLAGGGPRGKPRRAPPPSSAAPRAPIHYQGGSAAAAGPTTWRHPHTRLPSPDPQRSRARGARGTVTEPGTAERGWAEGRRERPRASIVSRAAGRTGESGRERAGERGGRIVCLFYRRQQRRETA